MSIHQDAQTIIRQALKACLPDQAVRRALEEKDFGPGKLYLVAEKYGLHQLTEISRFS